MFIMHSLCPRRVDALEKGKDATPHRLRPAMFIMHSLCPRRVDALEKGEDATPHRLRPAMSIMHSLCLRRVELVKTRDDNAAPPAPGNLHHARVSTSSDTGAVKQQF
jgi:hypothetical protein